MKDTASDNASTFWTRMGKVTAGMLQTAPDRFVPMSHFSDEEGQVLWFIAAMGSQPHQSAIEKRACSYVVADQDARLYGSLTGTLHDVNAPGKLDEIWNRAAAAWFEGGRDDPDIRLLCFRPSHADLWLTPGGAKFLYEIARANAGKHRPEVGEQVSLTF